LQEADALSIPMRMCAIFLQHGDELVELVEQRYEAEDILQQLLAVYPNLLAGPGLGSAETLAAREARAWDRVRGGRAGPLEPRSPCSLMRKACRR